MAKALLGGVSIAGALVFGWVAYRFFMACIQPWRTSPGTVHTTLVLGGVQLSGGQLFLPFGFLVMLAGVMLWLGIRILIARN